MMKIVLSFILFVGVVSLLTLFLLEADKGWILLNGSDAESYATNLLNNHTVETPGKFLDYSVNVSKGYVTFSKHNDHSTVYGYFPLEKLPEEAIDEPKLNWEPLGDNWFVTHIKP